MTFDEYHKRAVALIDNESDDEFKAYMAFTLGVVGEAGEIAEKFKKITWHRAGVVNDEDREELKKELGDVLWYLTALSEALGYSIGEVAELNLEKLEARKKRGVLRGDGDNR